jgi:hypothetical protein
VRATVEIKKKLLKKKIFIVRIIERKKGKEERKESNIP